MSTLAAGMLLKEVASALKMKGTSVAAAARKAPASAHESVTVEQQGLISTAGTASLQSPSSFTSAPNSGYFAAAD